MQTKKQSSMIVIEGSSGADLQIRYNHAMDELTEIGITIDEKIIDIQKMAAIILYSRTVRLPECLKDEYELQGIFPVCSECKRFRQTAPGRGTCERVQRGELLEDEPICRMRWREIEDELMERRYKSAEQLTRRAREARHQAEGAR